MPAVRGFDFVDRYAYLRARLLDLLIGDWDRHEGQWFWAGNHEISGDSTWTRWRPIPRDRDWAFPSVDGFVAFLAGLYYPAYVGFGPEYPSIRRLARSGLTLDRRFLTGLGREEFVRIADEMRATLTDDVLRDAVNALPSAHRALVADDLVGDLAARRDALPEAALDFHAVID